MMFRVQFEEMVIYAVPKQNRLDALRLALSDQFIHFAFMITIANESYRVGDLAQLEAANTRTHRRRLVQNIGERKVRTIGDDL